MKKKFFVIALAIVGTICINYSLNESDLAGDLALNQVEALASSEKGCINKDDKNNGDCTSDGTLYFCENSRYFHDCVKGEYPN